MKYKTKIYTIVSFVIIVIHMSSCKTKKMDGIRFDVIGSLQNMMTGSYDSSAQAAADSTYYNISLHMYPIWKDRRDGKYLYVEQALASMQDKPYRQRVYKLELLDDYSIASHVYTLKNDSLFIGKWKTPEIFDEYDLSLLDIREGCEVVLTKTDNTHFSYSGSTNKDHCKSTLRGAAYATSKVSMDSNKITSWDQGFDKDDKQVWGATEGPYIFIKYNKE